MLKALYRAKLESLIIDKRAFEELTTPKLGTSGMPLFYYISIEKLLDDKGHWQKFGDDSALMVKHAINCQKNQSFQEVSKILAEYATKYIGKKHFIGGYQRRDWPFSGICAYLNGCDHVSFYKDRRIELLKFPPSATKPSKQPVRLQAGQKFLFIGDLLNVGSTAINGWLPLLKSNAAVCTDVIYIFSRNQGGEANLKKRRIKPHSLIKLGVKFLERHCKNKTFCASYWRHPEATITMYLRKNGALNFLPYFDPDIDSSQRSRVFKFYYNWLEKILTNAQKTTLKDAVRLEFKTDLSEMLLDFAKTPPK